MAIEYQDHTAILKDVCTIEEGEQFFEWIKNQDSPKIKLAEVQHIHTAIVQTILYLKPTIEGLEEDSFWGRFIFKDLPA